MRVSGLVALEMEAAALQQAITNQIAEMQQQAPNARAEHRSMNKVLLVVLALGGIVGLRLLAPTFSEYLERRRETRERAPSAQIRVAEEESFSKFADALMVGPCRTPADTPVAVASESPAVDSAKPAALPLPAKPEPQVGIASAAKDIAPLRALLVETSRATADAADQSGLEKLRQGLVTLKSKVELPELRPLWQIVSALEGLTQQLVSRPGSVTPSALHSLAGALDLVGELCKPGHLKPDLLTAPPVRLLAVDDDAICRHAVAFALKKVFSQPDLAVDAQTAFALVEGHTYDLIFLDVEMPDMNGFELCTLIRTTETNRSTPVVFITRHSDFAARAKSTLTGGRELIGKPFLIFEVALKALTLVLRRRLNMDEQPPVALPKAPVPENHPQSQPAPAALVTTA